MSLRLQPSPCWLCSSRASTLTPLPPRPPTRTTLSVSQRRHATLLRRPIRPYTFTQLVTLTDGSVSIQRTTSPTPVYKSIKDTRNHPMWNPSSQKLANLEEDEAGRLRAFRRRFGRGWDAEAAEKERDQDEADEKGGKGDDGAAGASRAGKRDSASSPGSDGAAEGDLMDLISGFDVPAGAGGRGNPSISAAKKVAGKGKK